MNTLTNARIVGVNVDPLIYHAPNANRGDAKLVMSASQLKDFAGCPKRWRDGYEGEDTKSTDWGSLIDCLALTPNEIEKRFAVCPEFYADAKTGENKPWNFNSNACKQWKEANFGKQIVKHRDWEEANNALVVMRRDETICDVIDCSEKQVQLMCNYEDAETGVTVPLKCLLDLVPDCRHERLGNSLVDLKTLRSAHPRAWKNQVNEYGYDLSAALYLDAYNSGTVDQDLRADSRFVIQENVFPWLTGLRMLSSEFIEAGRRKYLAALALYSKCISENKWPSHEEMAEGTGELVIDGFLVTSPEASML